MEGEESASADRGSDLMSPNEDMSTMWVGLTTVKLTANVGETNYRPTVLHRSNSVAAESPTEIYFCRNLCLKYT